MKIKTNTILTGIACCALFLPSAVQADVTLSTFDSTGWGNGMTGLTGTYADWTSATITQNATSLNVVSTQTGGGWMVPTSPTLINGVAGGENTLQLTIDIQPGNAANGINVVLFSGAGAHAGFSFDLTGLSGTQVLTKNLLIPDFYNGGSLATWNPSQIGTEMHIQGNFANNNALNISFADLRTVVPVPEPATLALAGLGGMAMLTLLRRRSGK
ncbi:MAG TPA: PEP-CTERM sorting domain-containing protein [Verrucomicrobiae bacterium]|nr:PEP-CTERM sorting domain-containing protein [Verrucomicrobiae bacterium]